MNKNFDFDNNLYLRTKLLRSGAMKLNTFTVMFVLWNYVLERKGVLAPLLIIIFTMCLLATFIDLGKIYLLKKEEQAQKSASRK